MGARALCPGQRLGLVVPGQGPYLRAAVLDAALEDVRSGRTLAVPEHLRDGHYAGAKRLGHGGSDDVGVFRLCAAGPCRRMSNPSI